MAENNRVQLKREELVGNETVLSDINPITNTESIDDSSKGVRLDKTLEKIWNDINNKLSRIVNSVNGRTGPVVVTSADVGLENVDNVSFDDIKEWVIEQIKLAFETHRLQLFDNMDDAALFASSHGSDYHGAPFYCDHGYVNEFVSYPDYRAQIGYFEYDDQSNSLVIHSKTINTIGATDNTIIYNTKIGDKDFRGGKIGVNIYKYEDALKIYNSTSGETATDGTLAESGLYIDKSKITSDVYFFDGCYGDGTSTDTSAFLFFTGEQTQSASRISFYLDDQLFLSGYTIYTRKQFKLHDFIYCNFNDDNCYESDGLVKNGIIPELLVRQPCLGQVTAAPTVTNPTAAYVVKFISIKPSASYGISYFPRHTSSIVNIDKVLSISPLMGNINGLTTSQQNLSGLTLFNDKTDNPGSHEIIDPEYNMSTPTGCRNVIVDSNTNNGTTINLNKSLCMIPSEENGVNLDNWPTDIPENITNPLVAKRGSYIGVNLEKKLNTNQENSPFAVNMSGLRISSDTDELDSDWFGHTIASDITNHSGGLSINTGSFLEIGSDPEYSDNVEEPLESEYYSTGKLNVRVDNMHAIHNSGDNQLGVNVATGRIYQTDPTSVYWLSGGLGFVDGGVTAPNQGLLQVNTGKNSGGLGIKNDYVINTTYSNGVIREETASNILCVQPYSFYRAETGRDSSPVQIHNSVIEEDIAHMIPTKNIYTDRVWNNIGELVNEYMRSPGNFDTEHVYIGGGKRFIVATTLTTYFVFYSDQNEYDEVITKLNNPDDPSEDFDKLSRQCHVLIIPAPNGTPDQYIVKASIFEPAVDDLRVPDLNHDGMVDPDDGSFIMHINSLLAGAITVYSDPTHRIFYTDITLETLLEPVANKVYIDQNDRGPVDAEHQFPMIYQSFVDETTGDVYLEKLEFDGHILDHTDYLNADVDRNGFIEATDGGWILIFNANNVAGIYGGDSVPVSEKWRIFLREELGYNIPSGTSAGSAVEIFSYTYEKGVRLRYNELKGLTTNPEYSGNNIEKYLGNDIANTLSIKISDRSAGIDIFDPLSSGALRFGTDGYLGVRVNDNNAYNAALPNKNTRFTSDDMTIGTKGLHIYEDNVLGIQLTPYGDLDNGQLKIDVDGCLKLSDDFHPNKESLTFSGQYSDGTPHTVAYNGEEQVTINLGPGLCFGPPPNEVI